MVKDIGKNKFDSIEDAVAYFKEIYEGLPEVVIQDAIEFCIRNPNALPDNHENINLKKVPRVKKEKEIHIDGAVEIYDSPDDPRIKVLKHREGATLLTEEEAEEVQRKVNEAIAQQTKEQEEEYYEKYEQYSKQLLKRKLRDKIQSKR